ncbi:acetyltransferase [Sporosarcina sp. Marseille-Q4063]|uniref:acetyltransferase n=1 Tax=Sporosarcina sp. Marseille-Q4063 TaxID=2810514 RepID=UPI001BAEF4C1|nr:acetyltransferase [Sporosarcina sp. Marseille-Q4063]QUW21255.1 acetyltransferase [Sporosarcina sp. Marseille-Q4063]
MKKVVIIGDSGHAKVVSDVVNSNDNMNVFAKLDDKYLEVFVEDDLIKGPISHLKELMNLESSLGVIMGIGANAVRKKIVEELNLDSKAYVSAIHSSAIVSPSVDIGIGTVVMPGAIVNADTMLGEHSIVNSGSVVEHDCVIADYGHVSPLAAITGGVNIGEGTHIGAGASVIPLMEIGQWSIVGAGAVVVSDIGDKLTVVGAPARIVKREGL